MLHQTWLRASLLAVGAAATLVAASCQSPAQAPGQAAAPAPAQTQSPAPAPQRAEAANPPPLIAGAHWHHFHVNSVDPAKSIAYYTRHHKSKPARFAGLQDAVWTQKSWLLFTKVNAKASTAHNTGIWHIGWGAPDPKTEYKKQVDLGATFAKPLTDISTQNGGTPDRFWFMYVESPDGTWIELNTARTDTFGHMHMFAEDPIAVADWYIRYFGVTGRALSTPQTPRTVRTNAQGLQTGPSASVNFDNVNMIIYPAAYARKAYPEDFKNSQQLQSTRGNVNDHFGVSVPNLDDALKVFRASNVPVTQEPREVKDASGKLLFKFAFIEGPEKVAIELIEDHSGHPPEEN